MQLIHYISVLGVEVLNNKNDCDITSSHKEAETEF